MSLLPETGQEAERLPGSLHAGANGSAAGTRGRSIDLNSFSDECRHLIDMEPFDDRTFDVCGRNARLFRHVPKLEPVTLKPKRGIERSEYRPFHLLPATDFGRCLRCPLCPGYPCPNGARGSTLGPLLKDAAPSLTIRTETEVDRVLFGSDGTVRSARKKS